MGRVTSGHGRPAERPACSAVPPRALVPRWWGDAAGVLAWLSMLVVVALWVSGGGLQDLVRPLGERGLDSAGPADRPGLRRPAARPGAADGPDPVRRAGLRPGRARPPAPARRLLVVQPDARARRAHHPRLRGRRRSRRDRRVRRPHPRLPRHAARRRRHRRADRGRGHVRPGRAGVRSATSRGTCCTCTPTSASASPCRTSSGPARTSCRNPVATVYWWTLWAAAAGAILVWRVGRAAAPGRCATGSWSRPSSPKARTPSVVGDARPSPDRLGRSAGSVLHLAVPRRARAGPAATRTRCRRRPPRDRLRITAKGDRGRQPAARGAAARDAGAHRGTRTAGCTAASGPAGR